MDARNSLEESKETPHVEYFIHANLLKLCMDAVPETHPKKIQLIALHQALLNNEIVKAKEHLESLRETTSLTSSVRLLILLHVPLLASYYLSHGDQDNAEQLYKSLANALHPTMQLLIKDKTILYLAIAEVRQSCGQYLESVEAYKKALAIPEVIREKIGLPYSQFLPLSNEQLEQRLIQLENLYVINLLNQAEPNFQDIKKRSDYFSHFLSDRIKRYRELLPYLNACVRNNLIYWVNKFYGTVLPRYLDWIETALTNAVDCELIFSDDHTVLAKVLQHIVEIGEQWLAHGQVEGVKKLYKLIGKHFNAEKNFKRRSHLDKHYKAQLKSLEKIYNQAVKLLSSKTAPSYSDEPRYELLISQHPLAAYKQRVIAARRRLIDAARGQREDFLEIQQRESLEITKCFSAIIHEVVEKLNPPPCSFEVMLTGSGTRGAMAPRSDVDIAVLISNDDFRKDNYFRNFIELLQLKLSTLGNDCIDIDPEDINGFLLKDSVDAPSGLPLIGTPRYLSQRHSPKRLFEKRKAKITPEEERKILEEATNNILVYAQLRPVLLYTKSTQADASAEVKGESLFDEYLNLIHKDLNEPHKWNQSTLALRTHVADFYLQKHLSELEEQYKKNPLSLVPGQVINLKKYIIQPLSFWLTDLAIHFGLTETVPLQSIYEQLTEEKGQGYKSIERLTISLNKILNGLKQYFTPDFYAHLKLDLKKLQAFQTTMQADSIAHESEHSLPDINSAYWIPPPDLALPSSIAFSNRERDYINQIHTLLLLPCYKVTTKFTLSTGSFDAPLKIIEIKFNTIKMHSAADKTTATILENLISLIYYRYQLGIYQRDIARKMLLGFQLQLTSQKLKEHFIITAIQVSKHLNLATEVEWLERMSFPNGPCIARDAELLCWEESLASTFNDVAYRLEAIDLQQPSSVADAKIASDNEVKADHIPSVKLTWFSKDYKNATSMPAQEVTKIFNGNGEPIATVNSPSQKHRRVFRIKDKSGKTIAYLKIFPELPGNQLMADSLSWGIGGYGALSKLLMLQVETRGKKITYPALLSKPADFNLRELIKNELKKIPNSLTLSRCDAELYPEDFTLFVLTSLWLNPEDEQWKNVGISSFQSELNPFSFRLIRFDSDHIFVDELGHRQTGFFSKEKVANVKSAVYCLNSMKHKLNKTAVLRFLSCDIEGLLRCLLVEVDAYNQLVSSSRGGLFDDSDINNWKDRYDCFIPGLITPNLLQWLFYRGQFIKGYLFKAYQANVLSISHNELRDALLPQAASYYQQAWENERLSPVERFDRLPTNYEQPKSIKSRDVQQPADYQSSLSTRTYLVKMGKDWQEWITEQSHQLRLTHLKKFIDGYRSIEEGKKGEMSEWVLFLRRLLEIFSPTPNGINVDFLEQLSKLDSLESLQLVTQFDFSLHAEVATDNLFSQLILRLPHLRKVDVSGCTHLTINLFRRLHKSHIKHLIAKQYQQDIGTVYGVFSFPELETLILDDSPQLKTLAIQAPKLKFLSLLRCPNVTKQVLESVRANSQHIQRLLISHNAELRTLQGQWPELEELVIEEGNLQRVQIEAPKLRKLSLRGNKNLTYVNTNSQALMEVNLEGCMLLTPEGVAGHLMDGRFAHLLTVRTPSEKGNLGWIKLKDYQHTYPAIAWLWFALDPSIWDEFNEKIKKLVDKLGKRGLKTAGEICLSNYLENCEGLREYQYFKLTMDAWQTFKKTQDASVEPIISYFAPKLPLDQQATVIGELVQGLNHKEFMVRYHSIRILSRFNITASTQHRSKIIEALIKMFNNWLSLLRSTQETPKAKRYTLSRSYFLDGPMIIETLSQYSAWLSSNVIKSCLIEAIQLNGPLMPAEAPPAIEEMRASLEISIAKSLSVLSAILDPRDREELFLTLFEFSRKKKKREILISRPSVLEWAGYNYSYRLASQSSKMEEQQISSYLQVVGANLLSKEVQHLKALLITKIEQPFPPLNNSQHDHYLYLDFLKALRFLSQDLTVMERENFISVIMVIGSYNYARINKVLECLQALNVGISFEKQEALVKFLIGFLHYIELERIDLAYKVMGSSDTATDVIVSIATNCSPAQRIVIFNELMAVESNYIMKSLLPFIELLALRERSRLTRRLIEVISAKENNMNEITWLMLKACRGEVTAEQLEQLVKHLIQKLKNYADRVGDTKRYIILMLRELSLDYSPSQRMQVIDAVIERTHTQDTSLEKAAVESIAPICSYLLPHQGKIVYERLKKEVSSDFYQRNSVTVLFEFCKSYGLTCDLNERIDMFNWLLQLLKHKNSIIQQEALEAFGNFKTFMGELPTTKNGELVDVLKEIGGSDLSTNRNLILICLSQLSSIFSPALVEDLAHMMVRRVDKPLDYGSTETLINSLGILSRNFTPALLRYVLNTLMGMYVRDDHPSRFFISKAILTIHQNASLDTISEIVDLKPEEEKKDDARSIVMISPLDASLPPTTLSPGSPAALSTAAASSAPPSSPPDLKKLMAQWLTYSVQHLNFRELRLQTQAKQYGFDCHNVNKDGNCLFHAVAHQIGITHDELRQRTTEHMLENLHLYKQFSEKDPDALINEIMTPGSWADDIFIRALSRALNITIAIIRSDGRDPTIFRREAPLAIIYLGYEVGVHYQSLIRQSLAEEKSQKNIDYYINRTAIDEWGIVESKPEKEIIKPSSQLFFPRRQRAKSLDLGKRIQIKPHRRLSLS